MAGRQRASLRLRPLNPSTAAKYQRVLIRAFGTQELGHDGFAVPAAVGSWGRASQEMLFWAISRACQERRVDPTRILEQLPPLTWQPRRKPDLPPETDLAAYEKLAAKLPPARRAFALLPLKMGLRSTELLTLTRSSAEAAVARGELRVLRKGGVEALLPAEHAKKLLAELLASSRAIGRPRLSTDPRLLIGRSLPPWGLAGEVLSPGSERTRYRLFHHLVMVLGKKAGIEGLHPHTLRHAFASRMLRDGATLAAVQYMMGHSDATMTMLYLHAEPGDVRKFLR